MDETLRKLEKLIGIVKQLRHPVNGCPWDRAQTLESIQDNIVEEATEAKEAIMKGDMHNLSEELGDVLLNVLLETQIAEEDGKFSLSDVCDQITNKLTVRHPHVFGDAPMPKSAQAAIDQWNAIKAKEKAQQQQ